MVAEMRAVRRAVPTLVLAVALVAALVAWGRHGGRESALGEVWANDAAETRADKQSLALEAVGRILQHHQPSAAVHPAHPDYWPGISFFAKRREQAWRARKEAEKTSALQQLRQQAPRGPSGQKLSPAQAAIAAKFNELSGASSTAYSKFQQEYAHETGEKLGAPAGHSPAGPAHARGSWGSTWNVGNVHEARERAPLRESGMGFKQSLEGEGEAEAPEAQEGARGEEGEGAEPQGRDEGKAMREGEDHEAALEAQVRELKNELGRVEGQVQEVRHGYNSGMHVEGGSTKSGAIWDGADRRLVTPSSALQGDEEAMAEGGGVAMGAEGEKDYDKYGVELDKWKDPTPLHYRDDIAGGVEVHTREDEIRKIREYQAKIAEEQGKMRDDWKKLMESPPEVTDATRPDIMDPDSFPTEGEAFHRKYQEMKDFKAAVEAFNHDPEFNPMIVLKAHHLVKYGIPAPESDNIYVWRQWYREALDKYKVVRHQVTDMAAGNWHDYDTDWDIHGLHRPGAYKKVWRTRDSWGPGKPHTAIVTSPDANFTYSAGGGVVEEADGGEIRNETSAEVHEAEAEAPGGEGEAAAAQATEEPSGDTAEATGEQGVAGEAAAEGTEEEEEAGGQEGGQEKAPVAALASKVDKLEKKLDTVVNLLESSHGATPEASALRATTTQHLAQHRPVERRLRKAYLPSAADRDRMAHGELPVDRSTAASMKRKVSSLAAASRPGAAPEQLRAAATAAALAALQSKAKGGSVAEEKILSHPPKSVLNWLAAAFRAADNGGDQGVAAPAVQTLASGKSLANVAKAPGARTGSASTVASARRVPASVQKMIARGAWKDGGGARSNAARKSPPLYTAADAKKDAAAQAAAKQAISSAESVDAPDTVVRAKGSSKSVMQTGPNPSQAAKVNADPLKRVAKAILVEGGSSKAKEAEGDVAKGDVDPEGKQYSAPVPRALTKKFVAGRTMYVPKYDHKRAGGDGWGWLW